jgi:hypothetical protein
MLAAACAPLHTPEVDVQATNTRLTQTEPAANVPRTPDGKPDLQGFWNTATLTPLERPRNATEGTLTAEEAAAIERNAEAWRASDDEPIDPDRGAPPVGGDGSRGAAGGVGGYNGFWIDAGTEVAEVNGQARTSLIVDPSDGRVPPLTPEARRRRYARRAGLQAPTSDAPENVAAGPGGAYDDFELRPLAERCLLGFGSTAGPPALPVMYNNIKQIVQTPDHVMILNEMVHDARIVRMSGQHLPATLRRWLGDSIGRWEGDTLVVETTNFTDKTRFRGSSPDLKVTERFTRLDEKTLLYQFTVEDPSTWTSSWSGEYPWTSSGEPIYEYACHEGNRAIEMILKGARLREAEAAAQPRK